MTWKALSMLDKVEKICVVGNGPLSDNDKLNINDDNKCPIVVRFNDMKNKRSDEKVSLQVVREHEQSHKYAGYDENDGHPVALVGYHAKTDMINSDRVKSRITVGPTHFKNIFSECPIRKRKEICEHASTGTLFLDHIQNKVKDIQIYGMNWNMHGFAHNIDEGSVIANCCKSCVVNQTPNDAYLPDEPFYLTIIDKLVKFIASPLQ
jgi:hypothetical protein